MVAQADGSTHSPAGSTSKRYTGVSSNNCPVWALHTPSKSAIFWMCKRQFFRSHYHATSLRGSSVPSGRPAAFILCLANLLPHLFINGMARCLLVCVYFALRRSGTAGVSIHDLPHRARRNWPFGGMDALTKPDAQLLAETGQPRLSVSSVRWRCWFQPRTRSFEPHRRMSSR